MNLIGSSIWATKMGAISDSSKPSNHCDTVTVVDAVVGGGEVGDIVRVEAHDTEIDTAVPRTSSHSFGVAEAIALGRQLGELPRRLVVYGIEGRRFGVGAKMSPEVRAAVEALVGHLRGSGWASSPAGSSSGDRGTMERYLHIPRLRCRRDT